jgi:uridine kinase
MAVSALRSLAEQLTELRWRRVAVDGVDGVGKTTFATALVDQLDEATGSIQVIHVDDYLNPPDVRHRRGRHSPLGFWLDSINTPGLRDAIESIESKVIVEGIFLHRDELVDLWDYSVYLHAPFEVATRRTATRDTAQGRQPGDPGRYVEGQRIYFRECTPWARASHVIDNTDPDFPVFMAKSPVA